MSGSGLFRRFGIVCLIATAAIAATSGLVLYQVLHRLVVEEAQLDAVRISQALRDCELKQYVSRCFRLNEAMSVSDEELSDLDREIRTFLAPFNIVKMKVFNRDKRIIFSTDPTIIGRLDADNENLAAALKGSAAISHHGTKDAVWDLADEQRVDVEIVETYVPVRDPAGKVVGSVEIYKDVTNEVAKVRATLLHAVAWLSIAVLAAFGVLLPIMRRAGRKIDAGNTALRSSEARYRSLAKALRDALDEFTQLINRAKDSPGQ
ncbi:hypothetical protein LCGC14_2944150, partial [marine sediment metagenome]